MLDYGWGTGNPSSIMLSSADQTSQPAGPVFDPYNFSPEPAAGFIDPHETSAHFGSSANQLPYPHYPNPTHFPNYYDGGGASASAFHPPPPPAGFTMVPKSEPMQLLEFDPRIGLNLGGRTYFATSSSEDDFVNRLYRRSRMFDPAGNNSSSPRCQAEGCAADLSHAKHYHRRHKVCEFHSKCATVVAAGLTQRFCQQCSRFHLLSEFDNGKRSCRKRLDDHNRRRRKSQQTNNNNTNNNNHQENSNTNNNSRLQPRSSPDSGPHSSSVTVAISPTDGFGNGSYSRPTSSSTASTGYTSMY